MAAPARIPGISCAHARVEEHTESGAGGIDPGYPISLKICHSSNGLYLSDPDGNARMAQMGYPMATAQTLPRLTSFPDTTSSPRCGCICLPCVHRPPRAQRARRGWRRQGIPNYPQRDGAPLDLRAAGLGSRQIVHCSWESGSTEASLIFSPTDDVLGREALHSRHLRRTGRSACAFSSTTDRSPCAPSRQVA